MRHSPSCPARRAIYVSTCSNNILRPIEPHVYQKGCVVGVRVDGAGRVGPAGETRVVGRHSIIITEDKNSPSCPGEKGWARRVRKPNRSCPAKRVIWTPETLRMSTCVAMRAVIRRSWGVLNGANTRWRLRPLANGLTNRNHHI